MATIIKVLTIPADLTKPMEVRPVVPDVAVMGALVGGWLEAVRLNDPPASMYLNEEGKLRGLPLNQRATELLQRHNPGFRDFIVGDVFVCGVPDRLGHETDCPDEYLGLGESHEPGSDPR